MLYDESEIQLMSNAIQPGMRKPGISPKPFQAIIDDYLRGIEFRGNRVLDIGPGQWDMLDLLKKKGASTTGVDNDATVCELGRRRGHEAVQADFRHGWPFKGTSFDGIFCRGSLNLFWFVEEDAMRDFLEGLGGSLGSGAWLWIAPWNKPSENQGEDAVSATRALVDDWARDNSVSISFPSEAVQKKYGIGYVIPRVELWTRT